MNDTYVVDASVIAKWYLLDEEGANMAASVLQAFAENRLTLVAPSLVSYEVARALQKAYRQRRIASDVAQQRLRDLHDLDLEVFHEPEILRLALQLAFRHACNFYDACYLALAEVLGVPFLCADERLQRQLAGRVDYLVTLDRLELPE